ncbi:hypothetical protein ABPG72_017374 [Tetrahymena utriculariae]
MKQKYVDYSQQSFLTLIPKLTIKFYVNELYGVINNFRVGEILGSFLIVFKNFELVFFGLLGERLDKLSNTDQNLSFLSQNQSFFTFFTDSSSVQGIVIFLLIVNLGILIVLLSIYLCYIFKMLKKEHKSIKLDQIKDQKNLECNNDDASLDLQVSTLYTSQQKINFTKYNSLKEIFSIILLINYHILLVPTIYLSFNYLNNPLFLICFVISAILGLLVCDCEFDYSVKSSNFLGKSFNLWQYLMLAIEVLCVVVFSLNNQGNITILVCLFLIKIIYYYFINPYYSQQAKQISLFSSIYFFILNFFILFCIEYQVFQGLEAFLMFFFIPFSWKLSKMICHYLNEQIKTKFQELSFQDCVVKGFEINQIIRQKNLFADLINTQLNSQRKIDFFNLISNFSSLSFEQLLSINKQGFQPSQQQSPHSLTKQKSQMEQFNVSSWQFKEENVMFDQIKQIIQIYLEKIIYGQKKFSNDFIYCYLIFLLEVKQSRKLYWLSFLMWRSKSKINQSIKQMQIIQTIQSIFEEEKLIIQKTQGHINPFYEGFISVIMFEQKIEIAHKLLDKCIGLKLLILNMMRQKLIVLQELIKLIENQQILLFQLRKILSQLTIINEDSIDLIQIQIYYLQCLSFNESDIKISQLNQYQKSYLSEIRNIFQKDSCVAFIYYDLSANQCYFSKVSQYFERIFSVKNEEIIGKKIDCFIPSKIQVQHQSYIKIFLEEQQSQLLENNGQLLLSEEEQKSNLIQQQRKNNSFRAQNMNQSFQPICKMGKQMILCLNGKRNLVPITIDLRINSLSYDQFGFTANIKKVKNSFDYILYDSSNFEIIGLSKNINEHLFPDVHLKKINLATLFPFLQDQQTKKDDNSQNMGTDYFNSEKSTLRVVKQSEAESEIQNNNSNSKRSGTANHSSYFHKKNLHQKKFDFITILQQPRNKKYSTYNTSYTNSTKDQSIAKINVEKDLIFVNMEVKIFETKYKDVQNLNYLQISKVKMINAFESPQFIINFIKENIDLYLLSFTQQKIDRIITDLIKKSKQQIQDLEQKQLAQLVSHQKQNNNDFQFPKDLLQHYYTKNSSMNFVYSNPNIENSMIQKDLNQSQTHKKVNERESAGTFNQIIEEELSVSNKSDQNNQMNLEYHNSFQNKHNQKQQSLAEISQNLEFLSNCQLPLISPDSTYFHAKQQHNESSSQLAFFNQANQENSLIAQMPDQSVNEYTKGNFQKKNSSILSSNVRDLKQNNQQKDQIQHQSTLDSKFFSPRVLSTNAPLESAKNFQSYSKLISSQSQQKFFSSDELKNIFAKQQQTFENSKDANKEKSKNRKKRKNEEYRDDQLDFLQNDWLAFKQKGLKALSKKNQIDEKRRVYELQIEIASTSKTKSSSSASAKRHLSKILSTDQRLPQMKVIQLIGLICFITLTSVTLQQYFSVMNSIKNSQLNLEVLDWPSEFRSKLYYMVKNFNLRYLLSFKDFQFPSDQAKASYAKQINANLFYSKDIIRNHLEKLGSSNPDRLIFYQLRTQTTQFIIPLYYNQSILNQTTSVVADQPGYVGVNVNISILYAALIFNQFCYWQTIGIGGRPEYFTIQNQLNMVESIINTEQSIIGVEQNEDNLINQQLNTLIAIIFSVSACCVGVILPLYTYIQIKKDKIVTLLSTFTNQKVNYLINDIYENYYNDKQFSKFQKNTPNNINFMKQPDSIKQNISQTTRLPKMSKLFCAFVLLIYIFIVSYPVIIKIITSNYLQQTSSNMNLAIQANSLKSYLGEIISINYHALVMKLYPQVKPLKLEWYMDYINLLNSLIKTYEGQVNNLTSDRYTLNRYNQASYNKIFYPLIENDICNVLSQNPSYIMNSTVFDVNNCQNIYNGFLKKGFQLSFIEFLTTLKDVSSIYSIPYNTQQYTSAQQNLFQTFNLKNFTDFQEYIEQTLNSLKYFIKDENNNYYNFIVQAQLGLTIYQIIVMMLIFVIGWYIFCLEMNKQINKTKKFLQIIDINTLIDNTYILTRSFERGSLLSIFLVLSKVLLILLIGIYNQDYSKITKVDTNLVVLNQSNYISTVQQQKYQISLQTIILVLNLIIIIYLIWCYVKFMIYGFFTFLNTGYNSQNNLQKSEVSEDDFLMSYILQAPIVYFCYIQIEFALAAFNLVLSIIIGFVIVDTDYNYSIFTNDKLARPFSSYNFLMFIFEMLLICLIVASNNLNCLLIGIYLLFQGWFSSLAIPYYQFQTRLWNTFGYFYFGSLSLAIFFSSLSSNQNSLTSLFMILFIPVFYKISFLYCQHQEDQSYYHLEGMFYGSQTITLKEVDKVIRLNLFGQSDSIKENKKKEITTFSLLAHKQQQFLKQDLKKLKILTNSQCQLKMISKQLENQEDNQDIEDTLKYFLKELIRKISNQKREEPNRIIYLVYLLEILNSKKSYWFEYSKYCKKKFALKQEQIIASIHQIFLKQKIISQKSFGFQNIFDYSYYSVLLFEQRIQNSQELISVAVKQKVELLSLMKKKQMDALMLLNKVSDLRNIQLKLKNELNSLANINNNNSDLITLQACYLESLAFCEKDLKIGFNSSSSLNNNFSEFNFQQIRSQIIKNHQKKTKQGFDIDQDNLINFAESSIYDADSCVVFASIEDGVDLVFKKVSNKFLEIFSVSLQDIIGKKVDAIMPTSFPIASEHKQYIASFLKKSSSDKSQTIGKVIFGQSSKGYIIPLALDFRLNYCYQLQEIGICGQLKCLQDQSDYIIFNAVSLSYLGMTKNISTNIFQKHQLNKKTDLGQFFPFLYKIKIEENIQKSSTTNGTEWEINTQNNQEMFSLVGENLLQTNRNQTRDEMIVEKIKTGLEFMLILQNKKESINPSQNNLMKIMYDKEYLFYFMEIKVLSPQYQELQNLSYVKISRTKALNPKQNGPLILQHLKENQDLYHSIFSKQFIDRIYTEVEVKYKKHNSSLELKNEIQFTLSDITYSNSQNCMLQSPQTLLLLSKNQNDKILKEEINKFSLNQLQDRTQFNQEIAKIGIQINQGNIQKIDQITEEDQSVSTISLSENLDRDNKIAQPYNIKNDQQKNYEESNKKVDVSPTCFVPINKEYSQKLNVKDFITTNNNREATILSDNYRDSQIMSDSKLAQPILSDNNRISQPIFQDKILLTEDEPKQNFDKDVSLRQKQSLIFNSPFLSPASPNQSQQELLRNRQSILFTNSQIYDNQKRKESFFTQGQNSITAINFGVMDNSCSTAYQQKFYQDKDCISFNQQQINESKDNLQEKNLLMSKQQQKKRIYNNRDQIDNQSSTKSRESSSSVKRILISLIKAESQIVAIRVINVIGFLAFIVLASVTIQQYVSFMQSIQVSSDNLTVQDWPTEIIVALYNTNRIFNFIKLERQNNFTFSSPASQTNFDKQYVNRLINQFPIYNELIDYMLTAKAGYMLFDKVSRYQTNFQLSLYYTLGDKRNVSSNRVNYYNEIRNSSLLYNLVVVNQYMNRVSRNPGARLQEYNLLSNYDYIVNGISDIQSFFVNYQVQQNSSIQNQLIILIGLIMIISAFCLFMIIPLYGYIQTKKDMIINLFCTFSTNSLQLMILKIRSNFYQNKAMTPHIKHIPQEIQILNSQVQGDQSQLKKQTLSSISKLPKYNAKLFLVILLAYILLSIYPIVNNTVIQNFLNQIQNNFHMLQQLNNIRQYLTKASAMAVSCLSMRIYPNAQTITIDQYQDQLAQIVSQINNILDQLTDISNQSIQSGRYNQQDFDNFFFPVFENNICELVQNYPQYNLNSTAFQTNLCQTIWDGFLQQGLKLAFKKFTENIKDLYSIIQITNKQQLNKLQTSLFKELDLIDFGNFLDYLQEVLNIQKQFLINNCNQYYQYLQKVQLILIIYQIILMAIIFGLGWYSFSKQLQSSLTLTKQYLQIINIYYLLDNNYILTFVKNNHKL